MKEEEWAKVLFQYVRIFGLNYNKKLLATYEGLYEEVHALG
jgi:hypothetical protein